MDERFPICRSADLSEGGEAVPFDVNYAGQTCRAFVIRYEGQPRAYLNRCTHVAMELDWQPNRIFDDTGQWLLCASHGAVYHPVDGSCTGGPCKGGLIKITVFETEGAVYWQTTYNLKPVVFC